MTQVTRENIHLIGTHLYSRIQGHDRDQTRPLMVRRIGAIKTWKTRPSEFRISAKYGLYDNFHITEYTCYGWDTDEENARHCLRISKWMAGHGFEGNFSLPGSHPLVVALGALQTVAPGDQYRAMWSRVVRVLENATALSNTGADPDVMQRNLIALQAVVGGKPTLLEEPVGLGTNADEREIAWEVLAEVAGYLGE